MRHLWGLRYFRGEIKPQVALFIGETITLRLLFFNIYDSQFSNEIVGRGEEMVNNKGRQRSPYENTKYPLG
jgi:hypothetical protein